MSMARFFSAISRSSNEQDNSPRGKLLRGALMAAVAGGIVAGEVAQAQSKVVNIYSYRQPQLVRNVTDQFTRETGIEVKILFAKDGLVERIDREGRFSPADLLLTTNFARLRQAVAEGIVQRVNDPQLRLAVPSHLRATDGSWYALTQRARIIYGSRDRVDQKSFSYADLASPKWRGKVCIRSGQHSYNLGLFAWIMAVRGEDYLRQWLVGLKDNLARSPVGNDRAQVKAIFSGRCDLAVGNTYYLGLMLTNEAQPEQMKWAASVRAIYPTLDNAGTHFNVSGMAMAKHSPNRANALRLMRWLVSRRAQEIYADENFEYPVRKDAKISKLVSAWGDPKQSDVSLSAVAANVARASEIVTEVGFND